MTKPTVFFSHSSRDERILKGLKEMLAQKLGSTLEIFLSSDGQSIHLGRNWVHKIEEALNKARIMFVFLSPSSLPSKWVYFESGFSYSKGIRVIPVGILGVDLNDVPAPLSLLQGFNIRNVDGLNNIITIINEEFKFSFKAIFTEQEYTSLFSSQELSLVSELGTYVSTVDEIVLKGVPRVDATLDKISEYLTQSQIEYQKTENYVYSYGATFHFIEKDKSVRISLDPNLTAITFPLAENVLRILDAVDQSSFHILLIFVNSVYEWPQYYKVTARLHNSGIALSPAGSFTFKNIEFKIAHYQSVKSATGTRKGRTYLDITFKKDHIDSSIIAELLELIFSREVLIVNEYL